jgi:hypothetical protein
MKQSQDTRDKLSRHSVRTQGLIAFSVGNTLYKVGSIALGTSSLSPITTAIHVLSTVLNTATYKLTSAAAKGIKQANQDALADSDSVENGQGEKLESFLEQTIIHAEEAYNKLEAGKTLVNESV